MNSFLKKFYSPFLVLVGFVMIFFFQNCGKQGVVSNLSSQSSMLDENTVGKSQGGIPCSGDGEIVRYADSNKSCSDTSNAKSASCIGGMANLPANFTKTSCKADPQSKACSIQVKGSIQGQEPQGQVIRYGKSLNCDNAANSEMVFKIEKTCSGKGETLDFGNADVYKDCKLIQSNELTHYVRLVWKDRLIKIHKYSRNSSNDWIKTTVWDGNKKTNYPSMGDSTHPHQKEVYETIGTRLSSALYLDKDSSGNNNSNTNLFQKSDVPLEALLGSNLIETKGTYVESVIDMNNLELAKDAKKFHAYDYALMYPDVTEYLAKSEVKNAQGNLFFPANPWVVNPSCRSLYPNSNVTNNIDWGEVYNNPQKTKIAYQCAYETLLAVFGTNRNDGQPIPSGSAEMDARLEFRKKFIVGLNGQGGEGPEYNLFLNHYQTSSVSQAIPNAGGSCAVCEFRNPNLLFDDVAYYYQYIYGSGNYGEIFDHNDVVISSLSGLGFMNYQSFGIYFKGSTVSGEVLSQDTVAQPFIPRFDEVAYLQDPKNFDVLQSVYIKTLKGTNAQQDKLSGLAQYVKFGRSELRRGYYLARPMF